PTSALQTSKTSSGASASAIPRPTPTASPSPIRRVTRSLSSKPVRTGRGAPATKARAARAAHPRSPARRAVLAARPARPAVGTQEHQRVKAGLPPEAAALGARPTERAGAALRIGNAIGGEPPLPIASSQRLTALRRYRSRPLNA